MAESPLRRWLLTAGGLTAVGVGILGIFLPVLPTTIFLLIASSLFLRAHPGLYRWLNKSRVLGVYIAAYRNKLGLTVAAKAWTIGFLWVSIGVSAFVFVESRWLCVVLAIVAISVTVHVLGLKTRGREAADSVAGT